jgi:hypothetical protein
MREILESTGAADAVTPEKFAGMIGKTEKAVIRMIQDNKLPFIEVANPDNPNPKRTQKLVYLPEYNRAMRDAYQNRPKEQRDAWLLWLSSN